MQFKINRLASLDHATGKLAMPVRYAYFIPDMTWCPELPGRTQIRRADYILNGEFIRQFLMVLVPEIIVSG